MSKYLISPLEKLDSIKPMEIYRSIKNNWKDIDISFYEGSDSSFSWDMTLQNYRIDGRFIDEDLLVLDGDIKGCSEFALWYRQQIPQGVDIVMYDESYSIDIQLTFSTTEQEIVQAFCY